MKQKLSAAVRSLSILGLALCSSLSFAQDNDQSADEGRALYTANQCWQCHGHEGQGGAAVRIAPTLYPFVAFAQFVRHGNLMPAYSPNVLSDEDLQQIWEFVRNIPEPPAVEDIPELSGS
jgi:mono/diheme cytochrome c family protein